MEWVLIGLAALVAIVFVFAFNSLVALRQRCRQAFADIDVQLDQRRNLVPNLVETVKGYAAHEHGTLQDVIAARNQAVAAQGSSGQAAAEAALTGALSRLMVVAEAYPDLKANANFIQLQEQLADLEANIAAARRFFNNAAAEYNAAREGFPAALFSNAMGFTPSSFFDLGAERAAAAVAPTVKF